MNKGILSFAAIFAVLIVLIGSQTLYVVDARENALVLQLGEPMKEIFEPGLYAKIPFIQNVIYFDSRLLVYNVPPAEAMTSDKKAIVLDNYVRWRITSPKEFYTTLRGVQGAQDRLDSIIYSELRAVIGKYGFADLVSGKRPEIMDQVKERANLSATGYGVEIKDVRIKRTDLPEANQNAIFERMKTERERQAKQYRSEGEEQALKIKSAADKDRIIQIADARRESEIIRGRGDADAIKIFAEAFSKAPDFYDFSRSLDVYKKSTKSNTRIMLDSESDFFKYMR